MLIKAFVVLCWGGFMGWLIRYEAFPHLFEDTVQGYAGLMRDMPAVRDSWTRVYDAQNQHVGYAHSSIELDDSGQSEDILLQSLLFLKIRMLDGAENLRVTSLIRLDVNLELSHFELSFYFGQYRGEVSAELMESGPLEITFRFQGTEFKRQITLPSNAVVLSPMMEAGLRTLRPGQTLRIRTVDPLSMTGEPREVVLRGERQEWITLHDSSEPVRTMRVAMDADDMTMLAWLDENGQVLRQETPFGLKLEAATTQDAISIPPDNALDPRDLLSTSPLPSFSIPGLATP